MNQKLAKRPVFKAISLFSGIGGLDFGFEAAGFELVNGQDLAEAAKIDGAMDDGAVIVGTADFEIAEEIGDLVLSGMNGGFFVGAYDAIGSEALAFEEFDGVADARSVPDLDGMCGRRESPEANALAVG